MYLSGKYYKPKQNNDQTVECLCFAYEFPKLFHSPTILRLNVQTFIATSFSFWKGIGHSRDFENKLEQLKLFQ